MLVHHHGDVYVVSIKAIPSEVSSVGNKVLAYGEVTGHRHQIIDGEVFADKDGQLYVRASEDTKLAHMDEAGNVFPVTDHETIKIHEGDYKVVIQEEYTPSGWQQVVD